MSDLIEKYLNLERSVKTQRNYKSQFNNFNDWLKSHRRNMSNFTADDVTRYINEKFQKGEWSKLDSANFFLKIIKSFCNWEIENLEDKIIGTRGAAFDSIQRRINKLKKVKKTRPPKMIRKIKIHTPLRLNDLFKMFRIMLDDDSDVGHWNFKTMYTLCYFGQRPGDLRATAKAWLMDSDKINKLEGKIVLITAKTRFEYLSFYNGTVMSDIIEEFFQKPRLFNVTEKAMWQRISRYSDDFGKRIYPKLARELFNTYMGFDNNHPLHDKYKVPLDDKFTKVLVGHRLGGDDQTDRYKFYPPEMIQEAMTKYHYLKNMEDEIIKIM